MKITSYLVFHNVTQALIVRDMLVSSKGECIAFKQGGTAIYRILGIEPNINYKPVLDYNLSWAGFLYS